MGQPTMQPISILIVDDHPLMREALAAAIDADPELTIAGEAANGWQAVERYAQLDPDVVIMDLAMPVMDGVAATAAICAQDPEARVLVLTSLTEESKVMQALSAGALGFLLKDASRAQILEGIRCVATGTPYMSPETTDKLMYAIQHGMPVKREVVQGAEPSARELDVLGMVVSGLTDAQIAVRLGMSVATVRVHMHHIVEKLQIEDRSDAIAWYRRQYPFAKLG
jgi:DNA-binding NarL/FixJ family response regulator